MTAPFTAICDPDQPPAVLDCSGWDVVVLVPGAVDSSFKVVACHIRPAGHEEISQGLGQRYVEGVTAKHVSPSKRAAGKTGAPSDATASQSDRSDPGSSSRDPGSSSSDPDTSSSDSDCSQPPPASREPECDCSPTEPDGSSPPHQAPRPPESRLTPAKVAKLLAGNEAVPMNYAMWMAGLRWSRNPLYEMNR